MPRLFVSHAAKDEELVEEFVDLLQVGIGIHPDEIFCSSLPGMGIPTGKEFIEYIRSKVTNPELVLLFITPEFLRSQFCNNEVGASWALSLPIHPLLVPPIDYVDVRGVLAGTQVGKLNEKECLNNLRDDLTEMLGLKPFRTSHWERKRDKFLVRLNTLLPTSGSTSTEVSTAHFTAEVDSTISSSGPWMKLGDSFFRVRRFEYHGTSNVAVQLIPGSSEEEAALRRLRPPAHGRGPTLGFAYQNEGGMAQIGNVTSLSEGNEAIWSLGFTVQEEQHGGFWNEMSFNEHSADEIAEMRVGRLLINFPPPPRRRSPGRKDDYLESIIAGDGNSQIRTDQCVVQAIVGKNRENLVDALSWARLEAVFRIKASGIVESILELVLGPIQGDKLHVRFRGQRPSRNPSNGPEMIEIEGDCDLT